MKSSGWPSSRTNDRCATVGASMRRPVSLRGKRLMADKKSDVVLPAWTPQDAYNSDLPRPPRPPGAPLTQPRTPPPAYLRPDRPLCRYANPARTIPQTDRPVQADQRDTARGGE